MKAIKLHSTQFFIAGIILAALVITSHFLIYGVPNNDDSLIHFTFASAVYDSLNNGNLISSGQPEANNGYGAFTVRFYPLLAAYSIASLYFITESWHVAGFLFFWLWMSMGGIGIFLFSKEWLDSKYAFLASILYIFEPYHNVQINALFANAEFVAGSVLVFCFLFTTRLLKHGKTGDVLGLAVSYSLLILSNIPITLIGSIVLGAYALGCFYFFRSDFSKGLKLLIGLVTGVLGSSFYLYRLFSELNWINHSDPEFLKVSDKNYEYYFVDHATAFFFGDLVLFNFIFLIAVPIAVILFKASRDTKRRIYPLIIVTVFSIFMSTTYSGVVWKVFPVLQNVQFPWRWFTVTSIGFGILVAVSTSILAQILAGKKIVLTLWISLFLVSNLFFTYAYVIRANLIDVSFVIASEELQKVVNINSHKPTYDVWQTIWTKKSAFSVKEKVIANGRDYEVYKWEGFDKQLRIDAGEAQNVRLAVSYYPHWKATVNGTPVEVSKTVDGAITIPVQSDESVIDLKFVEPLSIKIFLAVSCVTWLVLLMLFSLKAYNESRQKL
ncbi:MAG: 6-pyruvoyl-tetrahydropterin synthase-related protein [Pyrinomonadaceae bacterium]